MNNVPLRGKLFENAPLAQYTSWRVGGPARALYLPADISDLANFLQQLPSCETIFWLGLGSNLLIRDQGLDATVIVTQGQLLELTQIDETTVRAEACLSCAQIARFCARLGLVDLAFMAGIPGTMGGALAMNAGCFGGETWDYVNSVETIDRYGIIRTRLASDFVVHYREVERPKDEWFVAGHLRMERGNKQEALAKIRDCLARRAATQPTNLPSCGSVFRNPTGNYAAKLIEECGLKGYRIGGAVVSEKHANFILNEGSATSCDLENLMNVVAATVLEKTGVALQREVHIVGR